jgi:hypothetical protein
MITDRKKAFLHILWLGCLFMTIPMGLQAEYWDYFNIDLNAVKDKADEVLIGTLKPASPPFRTLKYKFYQIYPAEILKGEIRQDTGLLALRKNIQSSEGSMPLIDPDCQYMLFLKRATIEDKNAKIFDYACYALVSNWQGIISLEEKAREKRALQNIQKRYGVNILDDVPGFKEALRYSLTKEPKKELSSSTVKIYNALGLKKKE